VDAAYRATVGIGVATILVVITLAPGGVAVAEPILLVIPVLDDDVDPSPSAHRACA
jgi:hypothetical protein